MVRMCGVEVERWAENGFSLVSDMKSCFSLESGQCISSPPPLWASAHCLSRPFSAVLPWLTSQQWASVSVEPWTVMCDWSGPLCCPGRGGWIGHPWFRCPLPVFSTQRGRSVASWHKVGPSRLPSQKQLWTKPFSLEGASQAQWLTSLVPRDT